MAEITSLSSLAKTSVASTDFLLVANSATKAAKKFQLASLFPAVSTSGSSSETIYTSSTLTNKNQIVFKGIKSGDTGLLTVGTSSGNIELTVLEAGIDLSLCDNSAAGFLTSMDFTGAVTGTVAVTNGGTGLSSIAKGALLYASADDAISATAAMSTNGQLLIGNTTNGYPSVSTLTAGDNVTITNGAGSISIAASLQTLAANLDTATYNIDLATNYISDDGSDRGIYVHTNGKVIINDTGSTLTTSNAAAQLNLQGNNGEAIRLGNQGASQNTYFIRAIDGTSGGAGSRLHVNSGSGEGNGAGGSVSLNAGSGAGSGAGGDALMYAGDSASGTPGDVVLFTYNTSGTSGAGLTVSGGDSRDTTIHAKLLVPNNPIYAREGIRTKQGAVVTIADDATAIASAKVSPGIIKITPTADRTKATPNASDLITDLGLTADNDSFDMFFVNDASGSHDLTLSAGTGVTFIGNEVIKHKDNNDNAAQSGSAMYRIRRSGSSTVDWIRLA